MHYHFLMTRLDSVFVDPTALAVPVRWMEAVIAVANVVVVAVVNVATVFNVATPVGTTVLVVALVGGVDAGDVAAPVGMAVLAVLVVGVPAAIGESTAQRVAPFVALVLTSTMRAATAVVVVAFVHTAAVLLIVVVILRSSSSSSSGGVVGALVVNVVLLMATCSAHHHELVFSDLLAQNGLMRIRERTVLLRRGHGVVMRRSRHLHGSHHVLHGSHRVLLLADSIRGDGLVPAVIVRVRLGMRLRDRDVHLVSWDVRLGSRWLCCWLLRRWVPQKALEHAGGVALPLLSLSSLVARRLLLHRNLCEGQLLLVEMHCDLRVSLLHLFGQAQSFDLDSFSTLICQRVNLKVGDLLRELVSLRFQRLDLLVLACNGPVLLLELTVEIFLAVLRCFEF
jgi:hypothetical protein